MESLLFNTHKDGLGDDCGQARKNPFGLFVFAFGFVTQKALAVFQHRKLLDERIQQVRDLFGRATLRLKLGDPFPLAFDEYSGFGDTPNRSNKF